MLAMIALPALSYARGSSSYYWSLRHDQARAYSFTRHGVSPNMNLPDGPWGIDGAGVPRPELPPDAIPPLLMHALSLNDCPQKDAGLCSMWAFAGDTTHFIYGMNRTEFIEDAHETAEALPTSFYGMAMNGKAWVMEGSLTLVGGDPESAWIATQIMRTVSSDGRMRRWQWELRKHRRPPNMGAWYVESIGSSDRKGEFEID